MTHYLKAANKINTLLAFGADIRNDENVPVIGAVVKNNELTVFVNLRLAGNRWMILQLTKQKLFLVEGNNIEVICDMSDTSTMPTANKKKPDNIRQ